MLIPEVDVVLFDLGGVLLPFDQEKRVRVISDALGVPVASVRELVESGIGQLLDLGTADEVDLAVEMSRLADRPVGGAQARRLWLSVFEPPNSDVWNLMASVRERRPVGFLSDNPGFVREIFPRRDAFDHAFFSAELGLLKPSSDVFRAVEALLSVRPERILFIDDAIRNVEAARLAGWDAVHYTSHPDLVTELSRRSLP